MFLFLLFLSSCSSPPSSFLLPPPFQATTRSVPSTETRPSRTNRRRVLANRNRSRLPIPSRSAIDSARRSPRRRWISNWRSASKQQLQLLISMPILGICKSVRDGGYWMNRWGMKPRERDRAAEAAETRLREAPMLILVYKTFFIPPEPNLAGNPVFEVIGGDVKVAGFDIAGFFERRVEFSDRRVMAPPWKATEARRIATWTEMVEAERAGSGGWWWCGDGGEFGKGLEEAFWRLRDGGWDEDEVTEMMRMNGHDCVDDVDRLEMDGQDHGDGVEGFEMEGGDGMMKGRLCELMM